MRTFYDALVAVALGVVQVPGCVGSGAGLGSLAFSPDGKHVCYIQENRIEEKVVDGKIWSRSIDLHWCDTNAPTIESSTHINTLGLEHKGYINVGTEVEWSPHGSRIGVWTPHKVSIVDIDSGDKSEIRDGTITSFTWLSDWRLAYLARRIEGNTQRLVVCRIDFDTQQKTDVFAFPERPKNISIGAGHWSPSGTFLILMEPDGARQYHCVCLSDGTVRSFGQTDAHDVGVAWAPDSSRAFCVSNKVGPGDTFEAVLLEPGTGKITDCTRAFQGTFAGHAPSVAPLWTADSKYVLINALDINGHLVQPDPWQVVPLGQMLASRFTPPSEWSTIKPRLFRLPVVGWVGVVPTGNYGDSPMQYAADYSGRRVMALLEAYPHAVSPDGTMAATMGGDGHVKIHRLGNWWTAPDETPLSRPAPK